MKALFLASVVIGASALGSAAAAEPLTPAYNWSGFYLGVNAGGAWGHEDETLHLTGGWAGRAEVPGIESAGSQNSRPSAFTGGAQAGLNWQTGPAVLGIETDINWLRLHTNRFIPNVPNASTDTFSLAASSEMNWLATARGRIGYAFDRWLVYFTGGVAVAHTEFSQTLIQTNFAPGFVEAGTASATKSRAIIGGGFEYAASDRWSVKAEYLHADLGDLSFASAGKCPQPFTAGCAGFTGSHSNSLRLDIVRAGLNYKFN